MIARAPVMQWRLTATAALLAAAVLIFSGVGMALYEEQLYRLQQSKDLTEQASILAASVTAALTFDDSKATQEYVNALQANPELVAGGVYDGTNRIVAQFSRGHRLPSKLPAVSAAAPSGYLDVSSPVIVNHARIGNVYLRANAEPMGRKIARYAGIGLLMIMGALVLAVLAMSQDALNRANSELETRALALSEVNRRLEIEMEEHRKTEEALRQSIKMEAIGQLSGGIAHDFNNLLMIVKGNLQLLRRRLAKGTTVGVERYMELADEGLQRAANLTQRLLAFARRQPLVAAPVNLSELVSGMTDLVRHSVGEGVETKTLLNARWRTLCDANQMENVILNLAINARDAMPGGGTLTIATRDVTNATAPEGADGFIPGDYVELSVRDSGTGMSDETRKRAIDPFFTTKPLGRGTGLGLSMTFGFVRQSDGYLDIESTPGAGTTIRILMPKHVGA